MSELFAPVCSITTTRRRRFLWAAWWSAPPVREPFRKPDAAEGGARTRAEALAAAERAAGRALVEIDGRWARAWSRVLVGQKPWTARDQASAPLPPRQTAAAPTSIWSLLGVPPRASLEEIKRAFHERALATHPDHGGDPAAFRILRAAYKEACRRRERTARKPKARTR